MRDKAQASTALSLNGLLGLELSVGPRGAARFPGREKLPVMPRLNCKLAVLGDLHYEAPQDPIYRSAREQILKWGPEVVFQLGDHGGYSHCGTWQSFMEGLAFLNR